MARKIGHPMIRSVTSSEHRTVEISTVTIDRQTVLRAGALLIDAAGMLRMEAQEWRDRKSQMATGGGWTPATWAERCDRIADTNTRVATSMDQVAKKIAEMTS